MYRRASIPPPKFEVGDTVNIMSGSHVLYTGQIFSRVGYDDFVECWRYRVRVPQGGLKTYNETSLVAPNDDEAPSATIGSLEPNTIGSGSSKK